MLKLIATIGLPGSGKSTWAREQMLGREDTVCHAGRDALRIAHGFRRLGTPAQEAIVTAAQDAMIIASFQHGYTTVIVDDTNLRSTCRLQQLAYTCGAEFTVKDFRGVPLETCIERDAARPAGERVGEHVIRAMYDSLGEQDRAKVTA
jgi:tRNA uridine 5-carbamoylmethylation protein Kti12